MAAKPKPNNGLLIRSSSQTRTAPAAEAPLRAHDNLYLQKPVLHLTPAESPTDATPLGRRIGQYIHL
jgi:hypothetical protein